MIRKAVAAAVLLLALAGCGAAPATAPPPQSTADAPAVTGARPLDDPATVSIPALDVTDELVPVGLEPDRQMEIPPVDQVGWYELGVDIGAVGPAVLAGHVNYEGVPGSFAHIGNLTPGDIIHVTDRDGDLLTFEVYEVTDFPKAQFDYAAVFANTPGPELRLVTCSGRVVDHSYLDNTVVSARLA